MDQKDFVQTAIVDLCTVGQEADEAVRELEGLVNPGTHVKSSGEFFSARTTLKFDVANTARKDTQTQADGSAKTLVLGV
ncbi:MAG: hypothetical protein GY717_19825 [Rhodobacteraceae bacterium]|nr:hypothetical protein [Paracoccaceae bacterium]